MKNTRKAMFLSALILPGLGQISLKRYKTGFTIIIATLFSIYQLMNIAMQQANLVVNRIMMQGSVPDISAVSQTGDNTLYDLYFWLVVLCWTISLVDIWRLGRKA